MNGLEIISNLSLALATEDPDNHELGRSQECQERLMKHLLHSKASSHADASPSSWVPDKKIVLLSVRVGLRRLLVFVPDYLQSRNLNEGRGHCMPRLELGNVSSSESEKTKGAVRIWVRRFNPLNLSPHRREDRKLVFNCAIV
jgi:hypothetical protein